MRFEHRDEPMALAVGEEKEVIWVMGTAEWKIEPPRHLLVAERMVRWQLPLAGTTALTAYVLRLLAWNKTAFVLVKGQGVVLGVSPGYLQLMGQEYLAERIKAHREQAAALQETGDYADLKEVIGVEWRDLSKWAEAYGYTDPLPLMVTQRARRYNVTDPEDPTKDIAEIKEAIARWGNLETKPRDLALVTELILSSLVSSGSLLIWG